MVPTNIINTHFTLTFNKYKNNYKQLYNLKKYFKETLNIYKFINFNTLPKLYYKNHDNY